MKKIICKKTYDTENATLINKKVYGEFGDSTGYEERLYQTGDGLYFLYTNGGLDSKYTKENIIRVSKEEASKF